MGINSWQESKHLKTTPTEGNCLLLLIVFSGSLKRYPGLDPCYFSTYLPWHTSICIPKIRHSIPCKDVMFDIAKIKCISFKHSVIHKELRTLKTGWNLNEFCPLLTVTLGKSLNIFVPVSSSVKKNI